MAQGPNYNVILPFSTTNTIVPSTIVVGGLTVNGTISAQRFVALNAGDGLTPAFTFTGVGTNAGMFLNTATPGISFAYLGTIVGGLTMKSFAGGATAAAYVLGLPASPVYLTTDPASTTRLAVFRSDATTTADVFASNFRVFPGTNNNGLVSSNGVVGFIFDLDGNPAVKNTNSADGYAAVWDATQGGQYFCKPGVWLQQATTQVSLTTTRSMAHATNLASGITAVFVSMPTSIPGLQYTISNARSVTNTVVISPIAAADTLNVFGLTKAAGASVAASAAFASITFHCITSTQWLATDIMGTWV